MKPIKYVEGDATLPQGGGRKIIAHVCNDVGAWGAGFVLALSDRCLLPQAFYTDWVRTAAVLPPELDDNPFILGNIQFAPFFIGWKGDTFVCNMIAQSGWRGGGVARSVSAAQWPVRGEIPLKYDALRHCLRKLGLRAHASRSTIHMPRIGCGIAGGNWKDVSDIIFQEISAQNIEVTVYDLPQDTSAQDAIDRAQDAAITE